MAKVGKLSRKDGKECAKRVLVPRGDWAGQRAQRLSRKDGKENAETRLF